MPASADRDTKTRAGNHLSLPVAADTEIFAGAMVAVVDGIARPAGAVAAHQVVGIAAHGVDNGGGDAGDKRVLVRRNIAALLDSAAGNDAIDASWVSADCFVVDDITVANNDDGEERPRAGKIIQVTDAGVWVEFN